MRARAKRGAIAAALAAGLVLGLAACDPRVIATSCASSTSANATIAFDIPASYAFSSPRFIFVATDSETVGAAKPYTLVQVSVPGPNAVTGTATLTGLTPGASYTAQASIAVSDSGPLHFRFVSLGYSKPFTAPAC